MIASKRHEESSVDILSAELLFVFDFRGKNAVRGKLRGKLRGKAENGKSSFAHLKRENKQKRRKSGGNAMFSPDFFGAEERI